VIDSVSVYTLGKVLGKGEHFLPKIVLNKQYRFVIIARGETDDFVELHLRRPVGDRLGYVSHHGQSTGHR